MRSKQVLLAFAVTLFALPAFADWKPTSSPLFTKWAREVTPKNARPEYPRPQMTRADWQNLNGLWNIALGDPTTSMSQSTSTSAPLNEILVPFPIESALSGVGQLTDRATYTRTFEIPAGWKGKRVLLHFGAVDWESTVSVNNKIVGHHRGGYDPFSFDISSVLKSAGPQDLKVEVFDPTDAGDQPRGKQISIPHGIWYTPATGIWQTVWLEPVPQLYISDLIITPDIDKGTVSITPHVGSESRDVSVQMTVSDGARQIASVSGAPESANSVLIPDMKLWSPETPFLYTLRIDLKKGNQTLDSVQSYFGMRKIEVKDDGKAMRIMLNGKFVLQTGPLDQGFWPDGIYTAPTDMAMRYDLEMTKKFGFNMLRKHVKVEPERWYYWADKLGLLVWQDMPSGNNTTTDSKMQFERELQRMVETHRNHPSVIMWVVFNEGWGEFDAPRLTEFVKQLDPSRLVNNASGWTDMKAGDVVDMHMYPGPGCPPPEPSRAVVLGEFGGLTVNMEGHSWQEKKFGYQTLEDSEQFARRYENLWRGVYKLKDDPGLSAAVYTQITDVEGEANGLMTYDRAVNKIDPARAARAAHGRLPELEIKTVVPSSEHEAVTWRYTTEKPADDWFKPEFGDSAWKEGPAGFGTNPTPNAVIRTAWNTPDIYMRRIFELPTNINLKDLELWLHHDEGAEIYINGILAAKVRGYTTEYGDMPISGEARATLKPGKNAIAVHCRQTTGGQYIDVGFVTVTTKTK